MSFVYRQMPEAAALPMSSMAKKTGGITPADVAPGQWIMTPWGGSGEPLLVLEVQPTQVKVRRFWTPGEEWVSAEKLKTIEPVGVVTPPEGMVPEPLPENTVFFLSTGDPVFVSGKRYYHAVTQEPLVLPMFPVLAQLPMVRGGVTPPGPIQLPTV